MFGRSERCLAYISRIKLFQQIHVKHPKVSAHITKKTGFKFADRRSTPRRKTFSSSSWFFGYIRRDRLNSPLWFQSITAEGIRNIIQFVPQKPGNVQIGFITLPQKIWQRLVFFGGGNCVFSFPPGFPSHNKITTFKYLRPGRIQFLPLFTLNG